MERSISPAYMKTVCSKVLCPKTSAAGITHAQVQFYWDLSKIRFQPELLLREIILGGIGGWNGFVSSVYLTGPGPFLYHLYDDRGLDVLGGSQKLLLPLYHQFHDWILEYDLEKIDQMFAPAKE